jgi:hypothetical protein
LPSLEVNSSLELHRTIKETAEEALLSLATQHDVTYLIFTSTQERFCLSAGAKVYPWVLGAKCPVVTCQGSGFPDRSHFKRHWKEKHEEIIVKYICPHCNCRYKRRDDIVRHARVVHKLYISASSLSEVYQHNKEFVDPWPFTQETALATSLANI